MTVSLRNRRQLLGSSLGLTASMMFGLTSVARAVAAEAVTTKNLKQKIATAKTAQDHKAIAAYYQAEAAKAKAKVSEHRDMAEAYKKAGYGTASKIPGQPGTIEHCNHLEKTYEALAESLAMMAKEHEAMAASAK